MRLIDADAYIYSGDLINEPTIEAEPVRHGEWVHTDKAASWKGKDECSECQYHTADRVDLSCFNYCPNCGAKMDGLRNFAKEKEL